MNTQTCFPLPDLAKYRQESVEALADFRKAWDGICEGRSLLFVTAPVGLILVDVADRLNLTPAERYTFLGQLLLDEIETLMTEQETPIDD